MGDNPLFLSSSFKTQLNYKMHTYYKTHYNMIPLNSKSIPTITKISCSWTFHIFKRSGKITTMVGLVAMKKDGSETKQDIRTCVHNNQQIEHI